MHGKSSAPPDIVFGKKYVKGAKAEDTMRMPVQSEMQSFIEQRQEAVYLKSNNNQPPVGQSRARGYRLPDPIQRPDFRFGVASELSESAGDLIQMDRNVNTTDMPPERDITKPVDRKYNWAGARIDPIAHRFGDVSRNGDESVGNSLRMPDDTKIGSIAVARVQARQAPAGVPSRFGEPAPRPGGFVYGKPSTVDEWDVRRILQGVYSPEMLAADKDLGRSRHALKGAPNPVADRDRIFGVPSIRSDRKAPASRSVADKTNYGDEGTSGSLVNPTDHLPGDESNRSRPAGELRLLFEEAGFQFTDEEFSESCASAQEKHGVLSISSMRKTLNEHRHSARRA